MKIFRCLFLLAFSLLLTPAFCQGQDSGLDDLDTDSDGKVTKKEFQEYAKTRLPDFEQLKKFADRVDADKDGVISEDEFDGRMDALQALNDEPPEKKEMSDKQRKMIEEATKAFKATAKLVAKDDWKKATKGMTKEASDDYAVGVVTQSLTLTKMKLPPQLDVPAISEAKEATLDVLDEHKLTDIDISYFMRGRGGNSQSKDDDEDDDEMTPQEKAKAKQKKAKAKQKKLKAEVMAALDKDDQRWEVIAELRKATKGASFLRDVFASKVSASDSDVDDGVVFLTVNQSTPGGKVAVPTVLKMTSEKGEWKYDGLDSPRTQKAMQRTRQRLRGRRAPAAPTTDF